MSNWQNQQLKCLGVNLIDVVNGHSKEFISLVFGVLTLHQSEWQKASTWNPALETLYHCQFTLSTHLIKPNDLVIPSTDAAPQFLEIRNFPPLFIINFFTLVVEYNNADTSAGTSTNATTTTTTRALISLWKQPWCKYKQNQGGKKEKVWSLCMCSYLYLCQGCVHSPIRAAMLGFALVLALVLVYHHMYRIVSNWHDLSTH